MFKFFIRVITTIEIRQHLRFLYYRYFGGAYLGLDGLDRQLEKYVDYDNGFFVELGANDGRLYSNSYRFENKRGWKGVLIEPSPNKFLECLSLRGSNSKVFCNACVSFEYKNKFVEIVYSNHMSVARGVETDIEDAEEHAQKGAEFLIKGENIFTFGAVARPLNDILIEANAPKVIDFLSLDVEGAEIEVLKGLDFDDFSFKFMLIECRNFEKLSAFLNGKKYQYIKKLSVHDYLFKKDE